MAETPEYLYQEIAESFRRRIASGDLRPGERLPPVRELARRWSCTPGTVNRAYQILSDEGLVVSHRGRGTRVADVALQQRASRGSEIEYQEPLRWANLVNRAEQYLLEGAAAGYSASEVQSALTVAVSRWRELRASQKGKADEDEAESAFRFSGSHDLVVENLAAMLKEQSPPVALHLSFTGSLGGLMSLLRGEADVAGTHLWDEETDTYNEPFVRRFLPVGQTVLMTLAHRSLGLMVAGERAGEIESLHDLARGNVRLINRQRGSGTRLWLDVQLRELGIESTAIEGYEREVTTHVAVAQHLADGRADVGPGIYAAAVAYGLDFIPFAKERYDLVFWEKAWETTAAQAIVEVVTSQAFQRSVAAMGGYDTGESGRVWRL